MRYVLCVPTEVTDYTFQSIVLLGRETTKEEKCTLILNR